MSALGAYRALTGALELLAAPWEAAARAAGGDRAGRYGWGDAHGTTWVHAASLGEVRAAAPLVRALGAHRPGEDRTVSAGTSSGLAAWRRELERRAPGQAPVSVLAWPLDFPGATRRAFAARGPRRLVIVETELWPNALSAAFERGVRVAFVNARLSERKWPRPRLLAPMLRPLLVRVSAVAAQTEADAARWAELGVPRDALTVTGNTKYDQPAGEPDPAAARARLGSPAGARVWTWGSLRPGEEKALADAQRATRGAAFVVAPRHPERAAAQRAKLVALGATVVDWAPGEPFPDDGAIAWVPRLGVLNSLWEASDVATVGGTFAPYGGHSVAEPAARGVPVVVGPHHANARDVVDTLVARGAGRVAIDGREAADAFARWSADPAVLERARANAWQAVQDLSGASARTIGFLEARGFWG